MYDVKSIFDDVLLLIQSRLAPVTFETFFSDLKPLCVEDDYMIIETGKEVTKEIINKRFNHDLKQCLNELGYENLSLKVVVSGSYTEGDPTRTQKKQLDELAKSAGLNPKYTFENFVRCGTNDLAFVSSLAVAEQPGTAFNPLYIWGPSGLGKTHLMQAIGHHILKNDPSKKVLYVSSETFMNEMINSIGKNSEYFRDKYRKIDVLLIDDIQFLSGKSSTQVEFFHTFNALYEENKQIVISGDRPPEEIKELEDRIRSRFKSGMIVDVQAPDYESRVAILLKKVENNNIKTDISVLSYIAEHINTNIRELEGALTRVQGYSLLYPDRIIDVEMAKEALKDYFAEDETDIVNIPRIVEIVAERYNISTDDMYSQRKPREIAYPRQIAMYLCRKMTEEPLDKIGSFLGGRDHTTVIYAFRKIESELQGPGGEELRRSLEDMERRIKGE